MLSFLFSDMSQASSLQSEAYDTLPDFVDLDGRYVCPLCGRVLQHAMQTACGHRLCQGCLADLLADATGDAMCPVNEEGCEVLNQGENKVNNQLLQFNLCNARFNNSGTEVHF